MTTPLISIEDALALHGQDYVVFADASFHLPTSGRDAAAEYAAAHIKGACWFDINTIADPSSPLPHTMPKAPLFQRHMQQLGIGSDDLVIVYDNSPFYSSARAWFMLRYFGHHRVQVLNGGFKVWQNAAGPIESGPATEQPGKRFIIGDPVGNDGVRSLSAMKKHVETGNRQILDARSAGRFNGTEAEPRQGLASGHMPGAQNIPVGSLIDQETGCFKTAAELADIFAGIDATKPVVTTCGSGVTACGLALGLAMIGREDVAIYDGSWSEWGSRSECPVAV